jgi:hypothetical protein
MPILSEIIDDLRIRRILAAMDTEPADFARRQIAQQAGETFYYATEAMLCAGENGRSDFVLGAFEQVLIAWGKGPFPEITANNYREYQDELLPGAAR